MIDHGVSYDQVVDKIIEARSKQEAPLWEMAGYCYFLRQMMAVPAKTIGSDVGWSGRYVTMLAKTFECFPEPGDRAQDQTFSLHQVCASTSDPVGWLDKALENAWSVRELKRAIAEGKPNLSPLEQAEKAWERVEGILIDGDPEAVGYLKNEFISYLQGEGVVNGPAYTETQEEAEAQATTA